MITIRGMGAEEIKAMRKKLGTSVIAHEEPRGDYANLIDVTLSSDVYVHVSGRTLFIIYCHSQYIIDSIDYVEMIVR